MPTKKPPLNLSYSSTADARSCWKKFYYRDILGLQPKKKTSALGVGTIIHECFDKYFNRVSSKDILDHIENSYSKLIHGEFNPEDVERLKIDRDTCMGIWMSYPFNDMEFEEVQAEKKFNVRLGGLRGVRLVGRVDGLVKRGGKWWIREVKTTSLNQSQFQGRAAVSYQASGYIYGMEKQENIKIEGVLYDTIKRPLLRKRAQETASDFGERIIMDYADPKNKDFYYDRYYSYRSSYEIDEFERDLEELAREVRKRTKDSTWYRNTDACWTFGSECPYKRICWTANPSNEVLDAYYEKREKKVEVLNV